MPINLKNLRSQKNPSRKEWTLFNTIPVWQLHPLSIDIEIVLKTIEANFDRHLFGNIDEILIGKFKQLEEREVDALLLNDAIYITNKQESPESMIDDIIHEVGHSLEETYLYEIYFDRELEEEFLDKRSRLYYTLPSSLQSAKVKDLFFNPEFEKEMDDFLYKTLGYEKLAALSRDMFISPYAATSLREYFANGFNHALFHKQEQEIKSMCPALYRKIKLVLEFSTGLYDREDNDNEEEF